jgi:hypothetical protein
MKYLCLIYDDETKLAARSKNEADAFTGEYVTFTEAIRKSGHYLAARPCSPFRRPRPCGSAAARSPPPTGPSPKRRSSWAGSTSSPPGT